jgi:hypothetical protein
MPVIYLTHPVHGTKVATAEEEAKADEKQGWTRYTPGEQTPAAPAVNQLTRRSQQGKTDGDRRGTD